MDAVDIWNAVIEKASNRGVETLSSRETTIYHANRFICDFSNGGLSGFLYNISPDWSALATLEEAVRKIGAPEIGSLIAKVFRIFNRPAAQSEQKETWSVFLKRIDPDGEIERLQQELAGADGVLWDLLEQFTQKHYENLG